jgi:hypothetical protein
MHVKVRLPHAGSESGSGLEMCCDLFARHEGHTEAGRNCLLREVKQEVGNVGGVVRAPSTSTGRKGDEMRVRDNWVPVQPVLNALRTEPFELPTLGHESKGATVLRIRPSGQTKYCLQTDFPLRTSAKDTAEQRPGHHAPLKSPAS